MRPRRNILHHHFLANLLGSLQKADMKKPHAHRAILVLESPWGLDDSDANRSSVLPFIEGVAKYAGDTEVFHANFYDVSSFKKALECLCKTKYSNTTVYIAAHGSAGKIGNVDLFDAMASIALRSRDYNISGVLLGACYVGKDSTALEACIEDSAIRWCVGYASSAWWIEGTLIDCAILSAMTALTTDEHRDAETLTETLADALAPFASTYPIGKSRRGSAVALQDSLQAVIQPAGQGHRARNVSKQVFDASEQLQIAA